MATYILLRNNVESKSLSLEELQAMGLRSTDMIWVECQSWDWQRPAEIPELKVLLEGKAPLFKQISKPLPENTAEKNQTIKASHTTLPDQEQLAALPIISDKFETPPSTVITKVEQALTEEQDHKQKDIKKEEVGIAYKAAVILPTGNRQVPSPLVDEKLLKYAGLGIQAEPINTDPEKFRETKIEPELTTNYTRSLDEIKELYVKNLTEKSKKKKLVIPRQVKKYAVYAGLVLAGVLISLFFVNPKNKKQVLVQQTPAQPEKVSAMSSITPSDPVIIPPAEKVLPQNSVTPSEQVPEPKKLTIENSPAPVSVTTEKKPVAENPAITAAKEEKKEEDVPLLKRQLPQTEINSKVQVTANKYTLGSFGGIKNLEITVTNEADYMLDAVFVEINYLNLDDVKVNTEQIVFHSIGAGKTITMPVTKSRRGVKINYKITRVEISEGGITSTFQDN